MIIERKRRCPAKHHVDHENYCVDSVEHEVKRLLSLRLNWCDQCGEILVARQGIHSSSEENSKTLGPVVHVRPHEVLRSMVCDVQGGENEDEAEVRVSCCGSKHLEVFGLLHVEKHERNGHRRKTKEIDSVPRAVALLSIKWCRGLESGGNKKDNGNYLVLPA